MRLISGRCDPTRKQRLYTGLLLMRPFASSQLTAFLGVCAIAACASPLLAQGSSQRLGIDVAAIQQQSFQGNHFLTRPGGPGRQAMAAGDLDSVVTAKHTFRREGAIVGGILFGGLGFLISQMDDPDSGGRVSTAGLTLGGAALGALTGALIGNFLSRSDSTAAAQSPP
jgi:hypothetical protein